MFFWVNRVTISHGVASLSDKCQLKLGLRVFVCCVLLAYCYWPPTSLLLEYCRDTTMPNKCSEIGFWSPVKCPVFFICPAKCPVVFFGLCWDRWDNMYAWADDQAVLLLTGLFQGRGTWCKENRMLRHRRGSRKLYRILFFVTFCLKVGHSLHDCWLQLLVLFFFYTELWTCYNSVVCLLVYTPSVLWRCWLGGRKGIRPVKNWVVGCWLGYMSGARCRLAYGPADATATHCLLLQ